MPTRMQVLSGGFAYRLPGDALEAELARNGMFPLLVRRYTQVLMTQIAQMSACNLHHQLDQRLARWLLMRIDRIALQTLVLTHETLAGLVGGRREGVTRALRRMQSARMIECGRGTIEVLDRAGLEAACCECYSVIEREAERLLPRRPSAAVHPAPSDAATP